MDKEILRVHFPNGTLPARGFRCPVCGEESFMGSDAQDVQDDAHRLGLFGVENEQRRKLLRTGNSTAVSIDPDLLRGVLNGAKAGDEIRMGQQGDKIVIRRG